MKLTDLDRALTTFEGQELKTRKSENEPEVAVTRRLVLLNCLGSTKPDNGKQSIELYQLGTRVAKDNDVKVDANEFLLIKKAVEQNNPGYLLVVQGQILEYLGLVEESLTKPEATV